MSNFEKTERHVANSLKQHPENMRGPMHELQNLQHHESAAAFKQHLGKLNEDLHKQGLLPGLQITENEKTHKLELKREDGSPVTPTAPEQPAANEQTKPGHGGSGGGHGGRGGGDRHHHGKHHGKHHKHHGKGGEQGQDENSDEQGQNPSDEQKPGNDATGKDPKGKDQKEPTDNSKPGNDPDQKKDSQNLTKEDKEKYLMKRLTDSHEGGLHLTKAQAAGVIGNLEHESHLNQDYSHHTNGDGREEHNLGIAQWVGKRKHDLEKWAGKDATNFYKQVDFIEHELQTNEKGALNGLRRTKDASHAALAFSRLYERPGAPHNSERVRNAQIAFNKYRSMDDAEV